LRRYNEERPHEGIGDQTPATLWTPSPRLYPERVTPPQYPAAPGGPPRQHRRNVSAARPSALPEPRAPGEDIGLEEAADGIWNIVYYSTLLGKIDERTARITGIRPGK